MPYVVTQNFLHPALYILLPLETVATKFSLLRQEIFSSTYLLCHDKVNNVATEFLWFLNNLCRDRIFFCRDRLFFSYPYRWLWCLLRHGDICYDKIDLAHLNSLSISVATEFSSVAIEFYQPSAFIVAKENFFVATEILPSILHHVAT